MRKHYIDNLRSLTILLLFPVHTLMIWNDFGNRFYIWMGENRLLSTLIVSVNPWFMPLLFVLAGMSARYSLEKRTVRGYILQRTQKLLLPFILGVLLLVPLQTFYARRFFDAYAGGLLENWRYFFTHLTDFSGYDGAFTPGHLWFILFLFLISMISLPLFKYIPDQKAAEKIEKMSIWGIASLSIPLWIMYHIGNFGGFSIGKDLTLYLFGYYIISNDAVMETMEKKQERTGHFVVSGYGCAGGPLLPFSLLWRSVDRSHRMDLHPDTACFGKKISGPDMPPAPLSQQGILSDLYFTPDNPGRAGLLCHPAPYKNPHTDIPHLYGNFYPDHTCLSSDPEDPRCPKDHRDQMTHRHPAV